MATDAQTLIAEAKCYLCAGTSIAEALELALLARRVNAGPVILCTTPQNFTSLVVTSVTTTEIRFAFGLPIPTAADHVVIRWGTVSGGPYPNSKTWLTNDPSAGIIGTADGLVADTEYYFVAQGLNAPNCLSAGTTAEVGEGLIHSQATAYNTLVQVRGGAAISSNSLLVVSRLFYDFDVHGFTYTGGSPDLVFYNILLSDNLIASITPQVDASGVAWTNNNFVLGDLTVNGLKGNGTNKSLGTGYLPATYWTDTTAHLMVYAQSAVAENSYDIGVSGNNLNSNFGIEPNWSDTHAYFEAWRFDLNNKVTANNLASPIAGFFLGCRTDANTMAMYFANNANAFQQIGSINGAQNGNAALGGIFTLFMFAQNSQGTIANFSTRRLSALSGGKGFSSAKGELLYNLTKRARVGLGGGTA